jgi:hypothetical protein
LVVTPIGNTLPLGRPAVCTTVTPEQLSVAVGTTNDTVAAHDPDTTFWGTEVHTGLMVSSTTTLKLAVVVLPAASSAVAVTVVVPRPNTLPLATLVVTVGAVLQVSVAVMAGQLTVALHCDVVA